MGTTDKGAEIYKTLVTLWYRQKGVNVDVEVKRNESKSA